MDVLLNEKTVDNYIRKEVVDNEGKTKLEKVKAQNSYEHKSYTYTALDENLKPVMVEREIFNPNLGSQGGHEMVKVPLIYTSNQIQQMIKTRVPVHIYTKDTLQDHPTIVIANLKKQLEEATKKKW